MTYTEKEARELIIRAGHKLLESGLTVRTWGNISARISSTHFLITPSGIGYDILQPDQLVRVRIDDCSYEGTIKPSGEKGIHAAAYRHRPDAGLVIHTHQEFASCVSISGKDLTDPGHPLLGERVPCAAYGLPGTGKLLRHVDEIMVKHPTANAFLMRNHGALCIGRDFDRAFELAEALEDAARRVFDSAVTLPETTEADNDMLLDRVAFSTVQHAALENCSAVQSVAARGKTLHPYLDDLAQIAGVSIRCAKAEPSAITKAMRGRNAVLVPGLGAVCCANQEEDIPAVTAIMRKGCMAALYAATCSAAPLNWLDCLLMRLVYTKSYSKIDDRSIRTC